MRTFTRYTKGLGDAALGLRASKLGQYWDWVALAAVGAESADTMKLLTEYANAGDAVESQYVVDFTAPLNGPWDLEIVVISTGRTIAVGSTTEATTETNVTAILSAVNGFLPQTAHVFTAGEKIVVPQGDVMNLPFSLGSAHDCTGKRLYFYAWDNNTGQLFITKLECTLTDALNVIGTVPLTAVHLATLRSCTYEYVRFDADGTSNKHTIVQGPMVIGDSLAV